MVLALLTKEDTYGYQITKDIQEHFAVSESTLYPVLRRLQKNGSLTTYLFIVLSRFSHRRLLFCVKRVGYRQKSLYRSVRNATGSRIRICYRFQ